MKKLICLLAIALPLAATDSVGRFTTPNALDVRLAVVVEKWIQAQKNSDGTLKYAGDTPALRSQSLFNSILRLGMRDVYKAACRASPEDCTAVKAAKDDRTAGEAAVTTAIENIIQ